jgi:phospholipid/cholesterol/gamma-HCH transport system substrate-binding protein
MRRSVREALVGFSLLAAIGSGLGLWLWLKGISLSRDTWNIQASFLDAAGLAARSPVSYRGVQVGSVRRIKVTDRAVIADLEITDPSLRLSRPVLARVGTGSLLGGDAVVSLLSAGKPLPAAGPGPRDRRCDDSRMVCDRGKVAGIAAASLDSVTETVQKLLDEADRSKLVPQMVAATRTFEATAREAQQLTRESQLFIRDGQRLVKDLNGSVVKVDPILANLNSATADAAKATRHASNLAAALDNPRTKADLQATLANAKKLTDHWQAVGGDVSKLTGDPKFMDGIRSVSVGLAKFFEELYPAPTDAARERDARRRARRGGDPGANASRAPFVRAGASRPTLPPRPPGARPRASSAADQNMQRRGPQLPQQP